MVSATARTRSVLQKNAKKTQKMRRLVSSSKTIRKIDYWDKGVGNMKSSTVLTIVTIIVIVLTLTTAFFIFSYPKSKLGYAEVEGSLSMRPYPKLSHEVPTVMVYVLINQQHQKMIYLTQNGTPPSSLERFSENDTVKIEGVLYNREAVDNSETYLMIEVFSVSQSK